MNDEKYANLIERINSNNLRIMLVEDSAKYVDPVRPELEKLGHVDVFTNYDEAITGLVQNADNRRDLIRENFQTELPYDMVLTDMMFPQGAGKCLAKTDNADTKLEPLGYPIAMICSNLNVPMIGMSTDVNHHSGSMAYSFDHILKAANVKQKNNDYMWGNSIFIPQSHDGSNCAYKVGNEFGTEDELIAKGINDRELTFDGRLKDYSGIAKLLIEKQLEAYQK